MSDHTEHSPPSEHIDSIKTYALIWIALLILTGVTTAVAYVDLGNFSIIVALMIAFFKTMLVALYFMHVRHSTRLTRLVVVGGLLWIGILLALTMADVVTRNW